MPDAAEYFQTAGITALTYGPRSTAHSEGQPRNEIDPNRQVEDCSDALTFLSSLPTVDPKRVGFWGMSFGAAVSLCAAAVDKRAKFVIAVCPLTDFDLNPDKRSNVLAKAIKDRVSQIRGNPPFYLPMVTEAGENPAGFGAGGDTARYAQLVEVGKELAPNHVNRTTLQTYLKIFMWQPVPLWQYVSPTPIMFVVPELDTLSPTKSQLLQYDNLPEPKTVRIEPNVGHEDVIVRDHPRAVGAQVEFINASLDHHGAKMEE